MSDNKELQLLDRALNWFFSDRDWNSFDGIIVRLVFAVFVLFILVWLLRHIVEIIAALVESCQKLGVRFRATQEEKTAVRRRIQFSKVLESDLATLAKAENWNDQWFTDLEAEVEVEGVYFLRTWDRLIRKPAKGLRRVPSLMKATESSGEQFLMVVGEPGSGKSVALRHIAMEFATRATKSKSRRAIIPLYVNLKELPPPPIGGPNADFIRDFIVDNVRRGDADTAAYVREHWDEYRRDGNWFFLFDSFDEIPAVMHAPTNSPAIDQHANALRHFLQGMSGCRGIIASREFKGPRILPWSKLRILPLSPERREVLVENSFLPSDEKRKVQGHIAESGSKLLNNPLFLTLLCRYVKDEKKLPANDHELVLRHIIRLANRDGSYLIRHYKLKSEVASI